MFILFHKIRSHLYDGIHCIAKYDQDNNLINEIVYGPQIDEVLCSIDNSDTAHYYHQDALQSVTVITDGFANKSATYEYDVYGKIKDKTGSFDNEITYTGRWLDSDTELYYYRARWYDADAGRFISRDPIGTRGGINLYGYVDGNPIILIDPTGKMSGMPKQCTVTTIKGSPSVSCWRTSGPIGICNVACRGAAAYARNFVFGDTLRKFREGKVFWNSCENLPGNCWKGELINKGTKPLNVSAKADITHQKYPICTCTCELTRGNLELEWETYRVGCCDKK
ncbi:MAG: RHS repeat-associated core domain-containing protein [Candidatus Omnitrophica bacterium]|nr:RHS repeat-associated core domain-containing protein [Candidatus Omnitrophota bacterium]